MSYRGIFEKVLTQESRVQNMNVLPLIFLKLRPKRSVMITQEMCPIRAEISTHKNLGKCIYLLLV